MAQHDPKILPNGNILLFDKEYAEAQRQLGLERSHLYKKMRAYGINPRD